MNKQIVFALVVFLFATFSYSQPTQDDVNRSRDYFNKGVKQGIDGEYDKSLKSFDTAIEINPIYAKAFLYRGLTKTELNDHKGAIRDFTITIELDPAFSDQAHYFRGIAHKKTNDHESSIRDFSIAIRLNPDFISFFQRGKVYFEIKEYGRALQDFDIAYRLNPDYQEVYFYRGQTLYHLGQYQAAIEDLEKAKQYMPENSRVFYYSALARLEVQNSYVALEDLDKCIALDPYFADAYLARAQAKTNTGNLEQAYDDKEMAKALHEKEDTGAKTIEPKKDPVAQKTTPETLNIANFFSSGQGITQAKPATTKDVEADVTETEHEKTVVHTETEKQLTPEAKVHETITLDINQLGSGFYNKMLKNITPKGFGVQVASYSNTNNLQNLVNAYEDQFDKPVFINVTHVNGKKIFRIIIGQFEERPQAEALRDELRKSYFSDCFLVVFERLY